MPLPVYRSIPRPPASNPDAPRRGPAWAARVPAWVLLATSAVALGVSFPPSPLAPLAWVALVPLLLRWDAAQTPGRLLGEAYACLGGACLIAFHWVLLHDIRSAAIASAGGLILFPFLLALPFALSVPFRRQAGRGPGFAVLVAFALTMEGAISRGPLAFPWPLLGHTHALLDPFRQLADLAGPATLSAWLWALNGCAFGALVTRRPSRRVLALAGALALIGGAALYGAHRLDTPPPQDGQTTALLVQPALPALKWADTTDRARVDTLLRRAEAGLAGANANVDLVIWPETALPALPDSAQRALHARLQQWATAQDVALLTGAVEPAGVLPAGARTFYNTALLVRADSLQRYRKNYLVPFAEHVPFSEHWPALRAFGVPAGGVAGYRRARQQPILVGPDFQLGALICFESVFTHHLRAYVDPGRTTRPVDFLVTVAQDGWWGRSGGYRQHVAFSQLRAIAVRRAMAFVTATGQTALIGPDGSPHATIGWMEAATRTVSIPHVRGRSPYVRWGDWLSALAFAATAMAALWHAARLARNRWR